MTPGRTLHRLSLTLSSPLLRDHIEAQLADFQFEWSRASGPAARLSVLTRGYSAFWSAIGICALRGLMAELLALGWRDFFRMPAAFITVILLIAVSDSWVRTGSLWQWNRQLLDADSRYMWAMVVITLVVRRAPTARFMPRPLIAGLMFGVFAVVIGKLDPLRTLLLGWFPFLMSLVAWAVLERRMPANLNRDR
jgi:hypothetical protein